MKLRFTATHARCAGMTLIELSVATFLGSLILMVAGALSVYGARSVLAMNNYAELEQRSRNTLDILTRDIRQAKDLNSFATNQIVLNNLDSTTCTYTFSPSLGTLTRVKGGLSSVLLSDCDSLTFSVYQRSPSNNFTFYPATSNSTAKLIDVNWKCSKMIRGQKVNTESIQTAKIVIRN